jgi:hypothetical protein
MIFDIAEACTKKAVSTIYKIKSEFTVAASEAIEEVVAIIQIAAKYAFITEFAFVRAVAIHTIFIRVTILQMIAVFIVVAPKHEIAIFVFERVVRVLAVLRLRKLERDARLAKLQFFEFFQERHGSIVPKGAQQPGIFFCKFFLSVYD